jgi:hypothetical protein
MRWTLLLLIGIQSCAPVPVRDPDPPAHILIPLSVKDSDWICAEIGCGCSRVSEPSREIIDNHFSRVDR